jgi:hypothetical protein
MAARNASRVAVTVARSPAAEKTVITVADAMGVHSQPHAAATHAALRNDSVMLPSRRIVRLTRDLPSRKAGSRPWKMSFFFLSLNRCRRRVVNPFDKRSKV